MGRKLVIALVVLAALAGGAAFFLRKQLLATPPAPPELARVADPTSQRRLPGGGEVVGYTGRYGSHVWLGIPYAAPPVGEQRWRAPAPPAAWSGTREAHDSKRSDVDEWRGLRVSSLSELQAIIG